MILNNLEVQNVAKISLFYFCFFCLQIFLVFMFFIFRIIFGQTFYGTWFIKGTHPFHLLMRDLRSMVWKAKYHNCLLGWTKILTF
jgi:hypothetical protein